MTFKQISFVSQTIRIIRTWGPLALGWGVAATVGVIFLGERIGPLRRDVYSKLPIIGHRYDDWRVQPAATNKGAIEEGNEEE